MLDVKYTNEFPEDVFEILKNMEEGNNRFVNNMHFDKDFIKQRQILINGQKPQVIILTCSDSRVVPAYIFDEDLGTSFVIRSAGNVIDSIIMGSIEYAGIYLGAKLLLILGHESCGGIKAAFNGNCESVHLSKTLSLITPAVRFAKSLKYDDTQTIELATIENIKNQMKKVYSESPILKKMNESKQFFIVGAYYSLSTGKVEFL